MQRQPPIVVCAARALRKGSQQRTHGTTRAALGAQMDGQPPEHIRMASRVRLRIDQQHKRRLSRTRRARRQVKRQPAVPERRGGSSSVLAEQGVHHGSRSAKMRRKMQ
eukprot:1885869-Prymnesium_polylepis.3